MPEYVLRGIKVHFPYDAYDVQVWQLKHSTQHVLLDHAHCQAVQALPLGLTASAYSTSPWCSCSTVDLV